jgi:uncharacterized membrane protein YukC
MSSITDKKISALIIVSALSAAATAFAAIQNFDDMLKLAWNIVNWIFTFFLVAAAIYIIVAAFMYLTAGGDQEQISKAKKQLIYAIIAIAIAALSKTIVAVVGSILGAKVPIQ